jgi:drug/metabolite transporter (DMT)-like permease
MKNNAKYTFMMLITAAIWGFAFVAQVQGMEHIQTFTFNASRFFLGALALFPVAIIFERRSKDKYKSGKLRIACLLGGVALFCASAFQQFGIEYTKSAGVSGFITSLYIILVPFASFLLFKKKTAVSVIAGAVLAFGGLSLLCYKAGEGISFGIGEILLFIGALFWTAHVILVDYYAKDVPPLKFSVGQFAVCALLNGICVPIFEEPTWSAISDAGFAIFYCGVFSVGVAYTLQVIAQRRVEASRAVIVLSTESLFSAVGGAIFGIDNISFLGYVGCALIFCGVIVSQSECLSLIKFKGKNKNDESRQ